jgi:hypothetical protein
LLQKFPSETLLMPQKAYSKATMKKTHITSCINVYVLGTKQLVSPVQLPSTSVVGVQKVPSRAQCDGFGASAIFPGLVTTGIFLFPLLKFSVRTTIRE